MSDINLEQIDRAEAVAASWYQALLDSGDVNPASSVAPTELLDITRQIIALTSKDQFQTEAARAIGECLAQLGYQQVDIIGKVPAILSQMLTQGLDPIQVNTINTRLANVLTQVIAGFVDQKYQAALSEKENALQAYEAEWKRASEDRQESEQKSQAILQALPDTLGIVTLDGDVLFYHAGSEKILLYSRDAKFTNMREYLHADLVEELLGVYKQVVDTGQPRMYEFSATFNKLGKLYYQDTISPYAGNTVLVISRDITKQKRIEEDLRTSEERYRSVVEDQTELIARWKPDGRLTFVNKAVSSLLGLENEQLVGVNFNTILQPITENDTKSLYSSLGTLTPENPITQGQTQVLIAPGIPRWLEWRTRGIFNQDGQVTEYQTVASDITDIKRIQDELRESESRYRSSIVEDQLEYIARWTPGAVLTFVNKAVCTLMGMEYEQLIGTDFDDFLRPIDEDEARKLYAAFATMTPENPISQGRVYALVHNQHARWLEWRTRASFNGAGEAIEFQTVANDITDIKQAQDELRESEARYRSLVEAQTELICRFDRRGVVTFINEAGKRMFREVAHEAIGHNIWEYLQDIDPVTNQEVMTATYDLTPQNPSLSTELMVFGPSNQIMVLGVTTKAIFNEQGEVNEYQTTARNITDLKRMEVALRESEERYRSVVEIQTEFIGRFRPDGTITFVNKAAQRLFGSPPEALVGHSIFEFVPEVGQMLNQGAAGYTDILTPQNPSITDELRVTRADGVQAQLEIVTQAIFNDKGELIEFQTTGRDVTDLKRIEAALRESEERYRSVVEGQTELIARFLPDGTITFVNEAFCRFFSKSRQEILGSSALELIYEGDLHLIVQALDNLQQNSTQDLNKPYQTRVVLASGEIRWVESITSAITRPDGSFSEFQVVARDINDLKQAQETLEQQNELLHQLSDQLINVQELERQRIARELHDFVLNELGAMMIAPAEALTPKAVRDKNEKMIEQLRQTINGLRSPMLNYGLYAALEDLSDNYMDALHNGNIFEIDIPASLARFHSDIELHLFRIIQQACDNALQHAQAHRIRVSGTIENNCVNLCVEDDGIGFHLGAEIDLAHVLKEKHFGLVSMLERGKLIGANVHITSHPGAGTQVNVLWELQNNNYYGDMI